MSILVLLGVACALWKGVPIYRQYAAIRAFERAGGRIVTVKRRPDWLMKWAPAWLLNSGPNETNPRMRLFNEPFGAYADRSNSMSDADLLNLGVLPALKVINLSGTRVTDDGMHHITDVTSLEHLVIAHTQIGDAGLVRLKELRRLRSLRVTGSRVTDAGVADSILIRLVRVVSASPARFDGIDIPKGHIRRRSSKAGSSLLEPRRRYC